MGAKSPSVRLRLTIWYAGALSVILVIFAVGTFFFTRDRLLSQLAAELRRDVVAVRELVEHDPGELSELEEHGVVALFLAEQGTNILYETSAWRRLKFSALTPEQSPADQTALGEDGHLYRILIESGNSQGSPFRIAVARDEEAVRHAIASLAWVIGVGYPAALLLTLFLGYLLAGRLLAPVGKMARKAGEITAERLAERLSVENPNDEFGRLGTAFNDVLARLENSFDRLKRFTADASHELRTPLTALRSVGEVAMRDKQDSGTYRETIGSMLEEADRLGRLVDSLLTLTRADSGRANLRRESVNLGELVQETVEFLQVLSEERSQELSLEVNGEVIAVADRITLRQALVNLLDNAIKYTPLKGRISVSVRRSAGGDAVIEVKDSGPGVPPNEQVRIFERFYRIDKARSREDGGVGLGLAIAQSCIEANGGRIEVESVTGEGCMFRIVLPSV